MFIDRFIHSFVGRRIALVLAALLFACLAQAVTAQASPTAATYYIAPGGNDTAAGISTATAWKTFNRAWQTLKPGDTLLVMDGTYTQSVEPTINGQQGMPITVKALNDGRVTIDGQGQRRPVALGSNNQAWGSWFVIEGIVARNGTDAVVHVRANNNVFRRVSAYNASNDLNSTVFLLWSSNNLVEDVIVAGTGRYMIEVFGGGGATVTGNTLRRVFTKWEGWAGSDFCSVDWPNGNNIGVYSASNTTIENTIAYGRALKGIMVQANSDNAVANDNHVLGSMALLQGRDYDGSPWTWGVGQVQPTSRPGTKCTNLDNLSEGGSRVGFILFGQGTLTNNVFRDVLAADNYGAGFDAHRPYTRGTVSGNVLERAALVGNGVALDVQMPGVTVSQGAPILDRRYINRQLTDEPLLPWPMESRAVSELGLSIDALVTSAVRKAGGSVTPGPTATPGAATATPIVALSPTPAVTKTPVPTSTPAVTPAATSTLEAPRPSGMRVNVPLLNVPAGDPLLDANNWAIVTIGKMSPSGGYTQMRLVGADDGVRVFVQTMTQIASGSFYLTFKDRTQTVNYKAVAGWEFGQRCGSGTSGCRGWTASRLVPWNELGGKPVEGAEWPLKFQANGHEWAGTLRWGLPDYGGRNVAGAQVLTSLLSGDSMLGGGTECGAPDGPGYFPNWGSRNFGTSPYANVQAQWDIADWPCYSKYYAAWSLSGLPAGAQVVSATVEVRHFGNPGYGAGYASDGSKDTVMQVYEVAQPWQEMSINWDNAPLPTENISRILVKPIDITCAGKRYCQPGIPYALDVTEIVKRAQAEGRDWASMALYTAAGQYHSGKYFSSREGGEPPIVRIAYVTAGAQPTATPTTFPATATPPALTATPVAPTATPIAPTATPIAPTATPVAPTATPPSVNAPFPVVQVLDTFNRANGGVGTNWAGATSGYRIATQRLDIGATRDILWKPKSFGANQEVYVTLATIDPAATQMGLLLKATGGTTLTGMLEVLYSPKERNLQLWTYTQSGGWVRNQTSYGVTFNNGDRLGVRSYADGVVTVWRNSTSIGAWNITNWPYYMSGGYAGIYNHTAANGVMDDFGAGTISADPYNPVGMVEDESVAQAPASGATALQAAPTGARHLVDTTGAPIYLAGAIAEADMGASAEGYTFDFNSYLDMAAAGPLNTVRLWSWQTSPWMAAAAKGAADMPYVRTGTTPAADGMPQYDLATFDQAYFDRLRQAAVEADRRSLYVVVELFNSRGLGTGSWKLQPFAAGNNSNGVNGDVSSDGNGFELGSLADPALTALQDAYVRKVVATLNDLDNVLYQVSDEHAAFQLDWKQHMLRVVHESDQQSAIRHTAGAYAADANQAAALREAGANWVTMAYVEGLGVTDGIVFAVGPNGAPVDRSWAWKSLTRGYNVLASVTLDATTPDAPAGELLANLGDLRAFAMRAGVANLPPRNELCSTSYCLANQAAGAASYVVYAPAGGAVSVDLSATPGAMFYEWFDPASGKSLPVSMVEGGSVQSLAAPFAGDAVLYIYSAPEMTSHLYLPAVSNLGAP